MEYRYKYRVRLNDKEQRMIEDDTFFDVSKEDVTSLLKKLKLMMKPQPLMPNNFLVFRNLS